MAQDRKDENFSELYTLLLSLREEIDELNTNVRAMRTEMKGGTSVSGKKN